VTPLVLEAIDVRQNPAAVVDQIRSDGESLWALSGLLDRPCIDPQQVSDHAAVEPASAPRFAWRWQIYTRGEPAVPPRPEDAVWQHPPPEFRIDPEVLVADLTWLRQALEVEGLLKRETLWTAWLRFPGQYVPSRFGEPFRSILTSWLAFSERALKNGYKVAFRFDFGS
jgi:hypothetical protein